MEIFEDTEQVLKDELKQLCNKHGIEIDKKKSAVVLNKLGLLYQTRTPHKISLIKSAALLNAAIVRDCSCQKYHADLQNLCRHILDCAEVPQENLDLVEISKTVFDQVKKMRMSAKSALKQLKHILIQLEETREEQLVINYVMKVKCSQEKISSYYKSIMASISQHCKKIMGNLPCKFALVGMGSLARNEITPFSDFEHIIVLENYQKPEKLVQNSDFKECFRWYSVIFHTIVINFQETDLYSVCIQSLNDKSTPDGDWFYDRFTIQGISFDGMMQHACHFPLGKTETTKDFPWTAELIKSIDEMVKFLEAKDIKKGYKLSDLLTRTCFIDGDEAIYEQFAEKVKLTLRKDAEAQYINITEQIEEDSKNFDLVSNLGMFTADKTINVKRILYRSITLFLSALGRILGFDVNSGFQIVEELCKQTLVSEEGALRLSHAVAVGCHVRLFCYMKRGRQEDNIYNENESWGREKLMELTNIVVDEGNVVASVVAAFALHQIVRNYGVFQVTDYDSLLQKYNLSARIMFLVLFGMNADAIKVGDRYKITSDRPLNEHDCWALVSLGHAYISELQYKKCLDLYEICKRKIDLRPDVQYVLTFLKCNELYCHYLSGNYLLALSETNAMLKLDLKESCEKEILRLNGLSKFALQKYHEALSTYRDLFKNQSQSSLSWMKDINHAMNIRTVSLCLIKCGRKFQGLHMAYEGLNFLEMNDASAENNKMFTQIITSSPNSVNVPL